MKIAVSDSVLILIENSIRSSCRLNALKQGKKCLGMTIPSPATRVVSALESSIRSRL